ncbi:MAG: hypothetical protein K2P33_08730, partial [Acutalibacter sp.]|nr:hypothetical protein [Acutalibacter sp.]
MYPYKTFTIVTDNGPYITKLILKAPKSVRAECIDKDTFSVYVERIDPKTGKGFLENHTWPGPKIFPSQGYRPVSAAYPCDENGGKVYQSGHIALEMPYQMGAPIGYSMAASLREGGYNALVECRYRVTQVKDIPGEVPINGWIFDESQGDICPQLRGWQNGCSHYEP